MGERGNIVIKQSNSLNVSDIVFYTHWRGYETNEIVAQALNSPRGRNRWDDYGYLSRIIFDTLITGEEHEETGYAISTEVYDENYPPTVVNMEDKTVNGVPYEDFIKYHLKNDDQKVA